MIISILHELDTRAVDFVLAFPQTDLDVDVFMELPFGFEAVNGENRGYVLKLNKSLYGLKQAAHNWFHTLDRNFYLKTRTDRLESTIGIIGPQYGC